MPVRWSFEALAVEQFKNNKYERIFFKNKMMASQNTWYSDYLINELKKDLKSCLQADNFSDEKKNSFYRLNYYINYLSEIAETKIPDNLKLAFSLKIMDASAADAASNSLDSLLRNSRKTGFIPEHWQIQQLSKSE